MAEEVALQRQLLALGFAMSVREKSESDEQAAGIFRKQLTGISGLTADRLRRCLGVEQDADGLAAVLRVHPILGPGQYVGARVSIHGEGERATVQLRLPRTSDAVADNGWIATIDPEHLEPVLAMASAVHPTWSVVSGHHEGDDLVIEIGRGEAIKESGEVAIARFSGGATFEFADRGIPLSITPVSAG